MSATGEPTSSTIEFLALFWAKQLWCAPGRSTEGLGLTLSESDVRVEEDIPEHSFLLPLPAPVTQAFRCG